MKRIAIAAAAFVLITNATPVLAQTCSQGRAWDGPVSDALKRICGDEPPLYIGVPYEQRRAAFERACRAMVPNGWHEKARAEWNESCSDGTRLRP